MGIPKIHIFFVAFPPTNHLPKSRSMSCRCVWQASGLHRRRHQLAPPRERPRLVVDQLHAMIPSTAHFIWFGPDLPWGTFGVNVIGSVNLVKAAAPALERAGGGSVVLIGSQSTELPPPSPQLAYSASKGALRAVAIALATELGPKKIRVNAVSPGSVPTPGALELNTAEVYEKRAVINPLRRNGTEEDNSKAIAFLLSSDADYINGEILNVDGGTSACA